MLNIIVFNLVIILFFIFFLLIFKLTIKEEFPYYKKSNFMTASEKVLFRILVQLVGDKYYILPQVGLGRLIEVNKFGRERYRYLNKISQKSLDFVLLNKNDLSITLAIELDDSTHLLSDRQVRDEFVNKAMETTRIPLMRVKRQDYYDFSELKKRLIEYLT